jgi:hypothetical protein
LYGNPVFARLDVVGKTHANASVYVSRAPAAINPDSVRAIPLHNKRCRLVDAELGNDVLQNVSSVGQPTVFVELRVGPANSVGTSTKAREVEAAGIEVGRGPIVSVRIGQANEPRRF